MYILLEGRHPLYDPL